MKERSIDRQEEKIFVAVNEQITVPTKKGVQSVKYKTQDDYDIYNRPVF
ncbi:hypothetical protein [Neobacillus drentensis]